MRGLMRSKWLKGVLVLVLALMVVRCGSDDDFTDPRNSGGSSDPGCTNEDLTAGLYSFTIVDQIEGCGDLFSLLDRFGLIPEGPYFIQLQGYDALPQNVTLELPLPGSPQVTGTLSEVSGDIVLEVPASTPVNIDLPPQEGLPDSVAFSVQIGGTLCPVSTTRVDTDLTITIPQAVDPFTSVGCEIEATLRGTLQ